MNMALVIITIFFAVLGVIWAVEYLRAEHEFKESHAGKQKMKWVVSKARGMLPVWAQMIITEDMFENIVQYWFDGIKDLLDDGRLNSIEG